MNSPLRATPDMKADSAEISPILLDPWRCRARPDARRHRTLERPTANGALDDIVAARMKDLADRLAAGDCLAESHRPRRAARAIRRGDPARSRSLPLLDCARRPIADTDDDDWLPSPSMTVIAHAAPSQPAEAADSDRTAAGIDSGPAAGATDVHEIKRDRSEQNLQSLLAVLDPPTPLRLAGELPSARLVAADPPSQPPPEAHRCGRPSPPRSTRQRSRRWRREQCSRAMGRPTPATDEPLMLADQSDSDIRLVDLIKRQQSLLDQLNRYPPAPASTDAPPIDRPRSTILRLADVVRGRSAGADAAHDPPTTDRQLTRRRRCRPPASFVLPARRRMMTSSMLPERAPMIIERARAERVGPPRREHSAALAEPASGLRRRHRDSVGHRRLAPLRIVDSAPLNAGHPARDEPSHDGSPRSAAVEHARRIV